MLTPVAIEGVVQPGHMLTNQDGNSTASAGLQVLGCPYVPVDAQMCPYVPIRGVAVLTERAVET